MGKAFTCKPQSLNHHQTKTEVLKEISGKHLDWGLEDFDKISKLGRKGFGGKYKESQLVGDQKLWEMVQQTKVKSWL